MTALLTLSSSSRYWGWWGCFLQHNFRNYISCQESGSCGMEPLMVHTLKDFYQGVVKRRWKRFIVATCADFEEVQTRSAAEVQRCCFCLKPHSGSLAA